MSDNSYGREMQYDVEKLMHFENGTCMVLMKNHTVPQQWLLMWTESDGGFGKRKGHSELVLRCTYREICRRLAAPEVAKIEAEVEAELLNGKNIDVDRTIALFKRHARLLAANDKLMDGLEARDEARHERAKRRIDRLPEIKGIQPGRIRYGTTKSYLRAKPGSKKSATTPRYVTPSPHMSA